MKKKITAFLLAAACAATSLFSLTACFDKKDENGGDNGGNRPSATTPHEHTLKHVDGKEATETEEGNIEYWQCTSCNRYFADSKGEVEIAKSDTVIPVKTAEDKPTEFVMPENGFDINSEVEITFYHTMGKDLKAVLDSYIDEFNEIYPNIKIKSEAVGSYDNVLEQTVRDIYQKKQPNIVYSYPDHVADYNSLNAVVTLDGFLPDGEYKDMTVTRKNGTKEALGLTKAQEDDFINGFYEEGRRFGDGKMYTLPFSKSTEVLYYNKTFFEENNLTVPKTWDELEAVCKKIKEIEPDSIPLGYDSESNWFITMCEQYDSPYTSATGEHILFDNATNRAFVEKIKGWYDKGYVTTQETYGSYTSNLFKEQKAFMVIGSSAGAMNYCSYRIDGEYQYETGVAMIPQVDVDNPKVIFQGPSVCIFKQEDPQEVLASWLFVKYLTTNVEFQARFSCVSGYMPVLNSVKEHSVYQNMLATADGYQSINYLTLKAGFEMTDAFFAPPAFKGSNTVRNEVSKLFYSVLNGSKTLNQAFKDAVEECKRVIG